MNLFKKGILALGVIVLAVSCNDDYEAIQPLANSNGPGLSEISFSSFSVSAGADEDGLDDGTYVSVTPLAIGVTSYVVNFGHGEPVTIAENGGTASYDYPNTDTQVTYVITVTAKSNQGLADVSQTQNFTVTHTPSRPTSAPTSPSILNENVYKVFSDGTESNGAYSAYTNAISANFAASTSSELNEREVGDTGNDVIQYSRLQSPNAASISFASPVVVADVFGTGSFADYLHLDLHSIHSKGVNNVKISVGGQVFQQVLADDVWTSLVIDLAEEGITQIDAITFELADGGTANGEGTLNVDNILFYREPLAEAAFTFDDNARDYDVSFTSTTQGATSYLWDFGDGNTSTDANPTHSYTNDGAQRNYSVTLTTTNIRNNTSSLSAEVLVGEAGSIDPEILRGDFERSNGASDTDIRNAWKISTTGNSNPFGTSSDGSCTNYDGVETGSKTRGAKWSSSQRANSDGSARPGDTRYAYQAITVSPNTDYIFQYQYAIKTGGPDTNSVVGMILNGHYANSADALASNPLIKHVGAVAKGKFGDGGCSGATTVTQQFRSNAVGQVSIFFYTVNDRDAWIDNVKVYPVE